MKRSSRFVREMVMMAAMAAILFLQKEILAGIPNVQLVSFLILLYAKCTGLWRTGIIVTVYVLLDSVFWGSLNPIFTPAQWIGWMLGPLILCTLLKKVEDSIPLAFANVFFAFLYCWVMIIPTAWLIHVDIRKYILADIPFEIILAVSAFLPTLLLYEPMIRILRRLWNGNMQ
ncbi:MAG: hypothetical protein II882_06110 [Lachnospiraceae bacterium]|nr:hypothetical protein [Lachnospiraceae bacterium]